MESFGPQHGIGPARTDQDTRGRTVDLHALRYTFGTHLSKNGVAPRTAQAALRHSSLDLTMNVYTDPTLLDVSGLGDRGHQEEGAMLCDGASPNAFPAPNLSRSTSARASLAAAAEPSPDGLHESLRRLAPQFAALLNVIEGAPEGL